MRRKETFRILSAVLLWSSFVSAQEPDSVQELLTRAFRSELAAKNIPAAYVVLVEGQTTVWNEAFGFADPDRLIPASPGDVHRIASLSKLFTDIVAMQLVEQGRLDLDSPVRHLLPSFSPRNPFGKEITLRQLMSHRSGLVREPPVGNYFDPTEPDLHETVASLNSTELVYEPETRFKYSNAGIAVVGTVVEKITGIPFARHVEQALLTPLGMTSSSFEPRPDLLRRKPRAFLWTVDGRVFDAPSFQFGMGPAADMMSTTGDLALFIKALFRIAAGSDERVLKKASLEAMWSPQFVPSSRKNGCGLGFFVTDFHGMRKISHSGDVYGFATEFALLPDRNIGVVVVSTMNASNAWSARMAEYALQLMLSRQEQKPLPVFPATDTAPDSVRQRIRGRFERPPLTAEFFVRGNRLLMQERTSLVEVRSLGDKLLVDDKIRYGTVIQEYGSHIIVGSDTLYRATDGMPPPPPPRWEGLIGEYGWDHNTLYIHERNGRLHAQIEWYFSYPLREISPGVFAFPDYGLYHGERVVFNRDSAGKTTDVIAASVRFLRRAVGEDDVFRIVPREAVPALRSRALTAHPPTEHGKFRPTDLVEITRLDPTIRLDIRYATNRNFMGEVFYSQPRAFLQRPAAEALVQAHQWLGERGYGILLYDAYRPWYVTKMFWEATPDEQRHFVADPAQGSRHNRGCAVDVSLYKKTTGEPVPMVSGYDEFSFRAYPDYPGGSSIQRWHRELLRTAMELHGFSVYQYEWWHFDYDDWQNYRIENLPFEQIP